MRRPNSNVRAFAIAAILMVPLSVLAQRVERNFSSGPLEEMFQHRQQPETSPYDGEHADSEIRSAFLSAKSPLPDYDGKRAPLPEPVLPKVSPLALAYTYGTTSYGRSYGSGTNRLDRSELDPVRTFIEKAVLERHTVSVSYRPSDNWIFRAALPYHRVDARTIDALGDKTTTKFDEIGDAYVEAKRLIHPSRRFQLGVGLGLSLPSGSVNQIERNGGYPFAAQSGSGTYDLYPSITAHLERGRWIFGAGVSSIIHLGRNSTDYRLGNQYGIKFTAKRRVANWLEMEGWVEGYHIGKTDSTVNFEDPFLPVPFFEENTGGEFIDAGLTARMLHSGCPYGKRFFELRVWKPLYQNVNGTQILRDWGAGMGLGYAF